MSLVDIIAPADHQEGTKMIIQSWMKKIGSPIHADEPLVELETDKVTMEIEAPADGVLAEILIDIGAEIDPGTLLGRIATDVNTGDEIKVAVLTHTNHSTTTEKSQYDGPTNKTLSPSVRRFVLEHNLDVSQLIGTGKKGRVTLEDVKKHLATDKPLNQSPALAKPALETTRVPHTQMRRNIAKHMHHSVTTAPHVTAVFEADFSAAAAHRTENKTAFAQQGVNLTYTAYIMAACVQAMKAVPEVNSQWHDDFIEVFSDINIGVGTALDDKGLIVPVVRKVQEKNLFDIAKTLQTKIDRARDNTLTPEDVRGGTFTISNHGVSGSLLATPIIINQPQAAILGVGKLEKRAVVKTVNGNDMIAIRPMAYVSLTIDHRALDGHQTNEWLSTFVNTLEQWDNPKAQ